MAGLDRQGGACTWLRALEATLGLLASCSCRSLAWPGPQIEVALLSQATGEKEEPSGQREQEVEGHGSQSAAERNQASIQGRQSQWANHHAVTLRPFRVWATCLRYKPKESWEGVGSCEHSWVSDLFPTWRALLKPRIHFTQPEAGGGYLVCDFRGIRKSSQPETPTWGFFCVNHLPLQRL